MFPAWLSALAQRTLACSHHLHHQFVSAPPVVVPRIGVTTGVGSVGCDLETDAAAPDRAFDVDVQLHRLLQNALGFLLHPFWLRFNATPPFVGTQGSELKCVLQHAPLVRCSEVCVSAHFSFNRVLSIRCDCTVL